MRAIMCPRQSFVKICFLHCESKKGATLTMTITLSILDGFAKFFYSCKDHKIFNKPHINKKFCTFRARKTCFKCDFLSSIQSISRYLSNIMKINAKCPPFARTHHTCMETLFTFQQDSAAAHRARESCETIGRLLQCETPNFIPPGHLTAPNLNPVDYMVWGAMEQRVYKSRVNTVDELKERLIAVWSDFRRDIISVRRSLSI